MRQLKFSNRRAAMRPDIISSVAIHHAIAGLLHRVIAGMHHLLRIIADTCRHATEQIAHRNAVLITDVQE